MQAGVKERYDVFAAAYVSNSQNGAEAARIAGYKPSRGRQTACRLVTIEYVKDKIRELMAEIKAESIKNREQRQQFWTRMMDNSTASNGDRLRASELLGKSEADFTENFADRTVESSVPLTDEELKELKRLAGLATGLKVYSPEGDSKAG